MIALFLGAAVAVESPPAGADAAPSGAEKSCRARLAARAGGEISQFAVDRVRRTGSDTVLNGTFHVSKRPASRPGEMTPAHIINMGYSYECRLSAHKVAQVKVTALNE